MDALQRDQAMHHEVLNRFGIYKRPLILTHLKKHRSSAQKLCFASFIAIVFVLSVSVTLLDYTSANASANTILSLRLDRIYSNHKSNSSEISKLEGSKLVDLLNKTENNFPEPILNAQVHFNSNTAKDFHSNIASDNFFLLNTIEDNRYIDSKSNFPSINEINSNQQDNDINSGSTNIEASSTVRRQYDEYDPSSHSRKQRIMNSPPFQPGLNTFTADHTFHKPSQLHPPTFFQQSPITVFTDSYAQLRPYRYHKNVNSINDVIQYLDPSQIYITTPPPGFMHTANRERTIKFTGTYLRPLDDESNERSEEIPTGVPPEPIGPLLDGARPFIKGQNITDPFKSFKPFNPLEINRLQPSSTGGTFNPRENRDKSGSTFLPTPPFLVNSPCPLDPAKIQIPSTSAGPKTVAIFHPPDPGKLESAIEQRQYRKRRKRPFSLMLDIYPLNNNGVGPFAAASSNSKYSTIPKHLWGPYRPPLSGDELQLQATNNQLRTDNRMVVHLNLYPARFGRNPKFRKGRSNKEELMTVLSGGTFNKKSSSNGSDMNLATAVVKANEEQRQNDISIEKRIKLQQTTGEYISPENRK